jgi:glycosyltransferase involved in cell wall biosynthesis
LPPRVLHISHLDAYGGAARSAYRLHEGLRRCGANSRMLVGRKETSDPDVAEIELGRGDRLANRIGDRLGVQYLFLPSSFRLRTHPWVLQADVLQLANIHGGFFSHTSIPLLGRGKKLVWCLHDMWSFTGHCGFSLDSERWLTGCGRCPHLDTYPPVRRDATWINWRVKQAIYRLRPFTFVAPSEWLAGLARRSLLLSRFPVHVIPYGIDAEIYAPAPQAEARRSLGLAPDERVVLVVGLEPRKGSGLLPSILAHAVRGNGLTLLVAGETSPGPLPAAVTVRSLGHIVDERELAQAYSAADVFLMPTLMDNLPNTLLESLACETPAVATAVGGVAEVVEDGRTGLVRPAEPVALGAALAELLADAELRARLGAAGRATVRERFTIERQARAYLELYASLGPK